MFRTFPRSHLVLLLRVWFFLFREVEPRHLSWVSGTLVSLPCFFFAGGVRHSVLTDYGGRIDAVRACSGCLALCMALDVLRRVSGRHGFGAKSAVDLVSNVLITVDVWEYGMSIRDGRMSWFAMHMRKIWLPRSLCCLAWLRLEVAVIFLCVFGSTPCVLASTL